jgi:hypothetical protein
VLQRVTGPAFVIVSVTIATGYADCVICATELGKVPTVSASALILCLKRLKHEVAVSSGSDVVGDVIVRKSLNSAFKMAVRIANLEISLITQGLFFPKVGSLKIDGGSDRFISLHNMNA